MTSDVFHGDEVRNAFQSQMKGKDPLESQGISFDHTLIATMALFLVLILCQFVVLPGL